jgi:hypothetical protein
VKVARAQPDILGDIILWKMCDDIFGVECQKFPCETIANQNTGARGRKCNSGMAISVPVKV